MKKHALFLTLALIALTAVVFVYKQPKRQSSTPPLTTTQSEGDALHPMMIEAMRERDYPGGEIKIERQVSNNGVYTTYVISYPSDGYKIFALANLPAGSPPPGGWPVVLLLHGYINPDSYETLGGDYKFWLDGLSRQGYLVIKPDLRGHGQSEGKPESGQWSPVYTYDTLNLIASLKSYPQANSSKVGLAGHSMGGTIALRTIVTKPEAAKSAAILAGAVGSAYDLYYNWTRTDRQGPPPANFVSQRQQLVAAYGEPKDNPEFWDKTSPINYVSAITAAVQIHHGANDGTVPILFSDKLNKAMNDAGKPVEYYTYPADHQFNGQGQLVLNRLLDLFAKTLKQ